MPTSSFVRKTMRIDQEKLDCARKILGTRTDAETVDLALDLVSFHREVIRGVRSLAGTAIVRDIYAEEAED